MNINIPIKRLNGVKDKTLPTGQKVISIRYMTWEDDTEHAVNLVPSPDPNNKPKPDIERI